MITRRGFFRGLLAAATTVVARAYVPSALSFESEHDKLLRRYAALKSGRAEWMAHYNQLVARMMIYGDGWELPHEREVYGVGPGQAALRKLGDLVPDDNPIAIIDAWSVVDDQIAQLG